ncbi:MAG: ceramidase domain-containing protein [Rhodocyclaceae bacterium]|nr:ceramidase domain-containing protein [Rhodocyclaceae bacterium]
MNWHEQVFRYCERQDSAFWGEPFNAASNLAFLLAAWAGWRLLRARGAAAPDLYALVLLMACVGGGSFAFHTTATRWAELADMGFIALFQLVFLQRLLVRVFRRSTAAACAWLILFIAADRACAAWLPADLWNGSIAYAPALIALASASLVARRQQQSAARPLTAACALFTFSLALRSADRAVCAWLPAGTHAGWHLANAAVLYLLLAALVAARQPKNSL